MSSATTRQRTSRLFLKVRAFTRARPYLAVAAGAGVGYLLAGGLFTRTTGRALKMCSLLLKEPQVQHQLRHLVEGAVREVHLNAL